MANFIAKADASCRFSCLPVSGSQGWVRAYRACLQPLKKLNQSHRQHLISCALRASSSPGGILIMPPTAGGLFTQRSAAESTRAFITTKYWSSHVFINDLRWQQEGRFTPALFNFFLRGGCAFCVDWSWCTWLLDWGATLVRKGGAYLLSAHCWYRQDG